MNLMLKTKYQSLRLDLDCSVVNHLKKRFCKVFLRVYDIQLQHKSILLEKVIKKKIP